MSNVVSFQFNKSSITILTYYKIYEMLHMSTEDLGQGP